MRKVDLGDSRFLEPMLSLQARILRNDIILYQDGKSYVAKPHGWEKRGIINSIKRAFALKYHLFDEDEKLVSIVRYDLFHDYLMAEKEGYKSKLDLPTFNFEDNTYHFEDKHDKVIVLRLKPSVRLALEAKRFMKVYRLEFTKETSDLAPVLKELGIGFMIRWMCFYVGI